MVVMNIDEVNMRLKYSHVGAIIVVVSGLLLSGCMAMARATGDAYKGIGGVISDYGNGKYEDKQAQGPTKDSATNTAKGPKKGGAAN